MEQLQTVIEEIKLLLISQSDKLNAIQSEIQRQNEILRNIESILKTVLAGAVLYITIRLLWGVLYGWFFSRV